MFSRQKFLCNWNEGKNALKANCYRTKEGVYFHDTMIVKFERGRRVSLHTGGWKTVGTKDHINIVLQALGVNAYICQVKGIWYVDFIKGKVEFNEGMKLDII